MRVVLRLSFCGLGGIGRRSGSTRVWRGTSAGEPSGGERVSSSSTAARTRDGWLNGRILAGSEKAGSNFWLAEGATAIDERWGTFCGGRTVEFGPEMLRGPVILVRAAIWMPRGPLDGSRGMGATAGTDAGRVGALLRRSVVCSSRLGASFSRARSRRPVSESSP